MLEPLKYDLSQNTITFNFLKETKLVEGSFFIERKIKTDANLTWGISLAGGSDKDFFNNYTVHLSDDKTTKEVVHGNTRSILSGSSTSPDHVVNFKIRITKKPEYNTKQNRYPFSLVLSSLSGRQRTGTETLNINVIESLNKANEDDLVFYEIIACNFNAKATDNAVIPCDSNSRDGQECSRLKYIMVDKVGNHCSIQQAQTHEMSTDAAYRINLRNKNILNTDTNPSECYKLERLPKKPTNVEGIADCCNIRENPNETVCSVSSTDLMPYKDCDECLNPLKKSLKLTEQSIAYLLARGWLVDLGHENTGLGNIEIDLEDWENGVRDYEFKGFNVSATKDISRRFLPIGATFSQKIIDGQLPLGIINGNKKASMDSSYLRHTIIHSSEQSIELMTRLRAQFLFKQPMGAMVHGEQTKFAKLERIDNIDGERAFIKYLHTNTISNHLGFDKGRHFSVGGSYSYTFTDNISPVAGTGGTSQNISINSFFEISDILKLFADAPENETLSDFKVRARDTLKVEMSIRGSKPIKGTRDVVLKTLSEALVADQGTAGATAGLVSALQKIKNGDSVLNSFGLNYERYFTNGSRLRAFLSKEKKFNAKNFEKYPEDPPKDYKYTMSGLEIELEPLDGAVVSFIHHNGTGEMELGVNYTKNFKDVKFLNDIRNILGDGTMTLFSGISLIDSAESGDVDKRYGFNSSISIDGVIGKRKEVDGDNPLKVFMSGFTYNLNAGLIGGFNGKVAWEKSETFKAYESHRASINFNYKLRAVQEGAFSKPFFDADIGIDLTYKETLVDFDNLLGKIGFELRASAGAKLRNNDGEISEIVNASAVVSVRLKWENSILSYFGFGFDLHPSVGSSFGFSFVGETSVKMDGVKGTKGSDILATIPFGAFAFDIVMVDEFEKFIRVQHTSFFTTAGKSIEKVPVVGRLLGFPFRILGKFPILSVLGSKESVFEYLIRLIYVKFYIDFLKAVDDCEKEIFEKNKAAAILVAKEIETKVDKLITQPLGPKESRETVLDENKEFLEYIEYACLSPVGGNNSVCSLSSEIRKFFEIGGNEDTFHKHLEKKFHDSNKFKSFMEDFTVQKNRFIEEKIRLALGKLFKDPLDCDCVRRLFRVSQDLTKKIYIGAIGRFPQLGGNLGIIELFFEKIANIYFSILFERLMKGEFKVKPVDEYNCIASDLTENESMKSKLIEGIRKFYNKEDVMFSDIIKDYPNFNKNNVGLNYALSNKALGEGERDKELEAAAAKSGNQERVLGRIIKDCYEYGGRNNYCQSVFNEWIRFSKILGRTQELVDENNAPMFPNIKNEEGTNRWNLARAESNIMRREDWIEYMEDLFTVEKNSTSKITSKKCQCPDPYVSFYQDFDPVNPSEIMEKMMFFAGDNIPDKDLVAAIHSLSYVANHLDICNSEKIAVPTTESVKKLGYYYNSSVSVIEAKKASAPLGNGNNVNYANNPFLPNSRIKVLASDFLSRIVVLRKNIGSFNSKETLSDWYIYLATKKSNSDGVGLFSPTPLKYKNPYTKSDLDVTNDLDHFKNVRGFADRMKSILQKVAFTIISHGSSGDFKSFFYTVINELIPLIRDFNKEKTSVMNPGDLTGSEEEKLKKDLILRFTLSLKETAIDIIERDLHIFAEILKQIVEAELNANRDGLLSVVINHKDATIKSISDEIKKRLLYDNEENFDLEFLFNPSSLMKSLMPTSYEDGHGIGNARTKDQHKKINDNIGAYYYANKQLNGKGDNKNAKDISKDGENENCCTASPGKNQPNYKALYRSGINSPHRSQYQVALYNGLIETSEVGFSSGNGYRAISKMSSPYVLYSAVDTNRAATFSGTGLGLKDGRFLYPCGIILLNGIHGEGNLK